MTSTITPTLKNVNQTVNCNDDWLLNDPLGWEVLDDTDTGVDVDTDISFGTAIDDYVENQTNISDSTDEKDVAPASFVTRSVVSGSTLHDNAMTVHSNLSAIHPLETNLSATSNNLGHPMMSTDNPTHTAMTNNSAATSTPHSIPQNEPLLSNNAEPVVEFDGDTSRFNPHFKPLLPQPINRNETGRQLIMDTETTGLDAGKGDRIIEVGIVELVNRKFTGEKLHVYINPQRGMDEEVIRIHGITEAFLSDKPTFDQVAQPLYDFMVGAEVIAHNASFDMNFLDMEFAKVGLSDFAQRVRVTDSLAMAKQQYPGQKNTLDALVRRLNVGKMDRTFHGALLDSEILAEVYLTMTGGQVSLAIDEDTQSEGSGEHADFSHLASQLLAAKSHRSNHLQWVSQQLSKHPEIASSQGMTCFYTAKQTTSPSWLQRTPTCKALNVSPEQMLFLK